ncbi:MAG: hypothetical protein ACPGC9_00135 [Cytophagales bacterium]
MKRRKEDKNKTKKQGGRYSRKILILGSFLLLGLACWYFFVHKKDDKNPYVDFDSKSFYSNPKYRWKEKKLTFQPDDKGMKGGLAPLEGGVNKKDGWKWCAKYDINADMMKMKRVTTRPTGEKETAYITVVPAAEENAQMVYDFVRRSKKVKKDYFGHESTFKYLGTSVMQARHRLNQKALNFESNRCEYNVVLYSTDNKNFRVIGLTEINSLQKDKNYSNIAYHWAHPKVSQVRGTAYPTMYGLTYKWLKYGDSKKLVMGIHYENHNSIRLAADRLKATKTTAEELSKEGFVYNDNNNPDDERLIKNMVFYFLSQDNAPHEIV